MTNLNTNAYRFAQISIIIIGVIAIAAILYYLVVIRPVDIKMKKMKDDVRADFFKKDIREVI